MVKKSFSTMSCPLAQALDVIGEWWSLLIIRDFFIGDGVRRFEQLRDSLGISRNILTARLKTLTEAGVIVRVPLQEGGKRCAYQLTEKGSDLMPAMLALMQWGEKWQAGPRQRLVVVREKGTGDEIAPLRLQNQSGVPVAMRDVYLTLMGPQGERAATNWPPDQSEEPGVGNRAG